MKTQDELAMRIEASAARGKSNYFAAYASSQLVLLPVLLQRSQSPPERSIRISLLSKTASVGCPSS